MATLLSWQFDGRLCEFPPAQSSLVRNDSALVRRLAQVLVFCEQRVWSERSRHVHRRRGARPLLHELRSLKGCVRETYGGADARDPLRLKARDRLHRAKGPLAVTTEHAQRPLWRCGRAEAADRG